MAKRGKGKRGGSLKGRRRGRLGKLLSTEDKLAAEAEEYQRILDHMTMTPAQRARNIRFGIRKKEVEAEHKDRSRRFSSSKRGYSHSSHPDKKVIEARKLARRGILPPPVSQRKHGLEMEYVWAYQGPHGLETINAILTMPCKARIPKDAIGCIAQGSGYGRRAEWVGSAMARVWPSYPGEKTLWWQLQTFKTSTTTSLKNLRERMERGLTQWTELKLLTLEGMSFDENTTEEKPKRRKANKAKPKRNNRKKTKASKRKRMVSKSRRKKHQNH